MRPSQNYILDLQKKRCEYVLLSEFFQTHSAITHLKFNIAPEKLPSQKESNLPTTIFQGLC